MRKSSRARQMLTMVPAEVPVGSGFESWPGKSMDVTRCAQLELGAEM